MPHVRRRNELSLLDVHDPLAHGCGDNQICLAAEKCWDLQYVHNFRNFRNIGSFMDVSQYRNVHFIFYFFQDTQAFSQAGSSIAPNGSAIGFVVGRFKNEREVERASDSLDHFRHK